MGNTNRTLTAIFSQNGTFRDAYRWTVSLPLHLNIALTEKLRDKGDKENKTLSRILGEAMAQYLGEDYTKYDYKSARSARKKK